MARVTQAKRISSILALHALLTGPALSAVDPSINSDVRSLLDFAEEPTREKIERVKSVVRAHAILFAWGMISRDRKTDEETGDLLEYLDSLIPHSSFLLKRSAFVPRTLGIISVKKGIALPLFGYHRLEFPPVEPGLLLCYQSIESGETGCFDFVRLDAGSAVSYAGLGARIESANPWLRVRIGKAGHDELVTLAYPFEARGCERYSSESYELFIALAAVAVNSPAGGNTAPAGEVYDPLEYRYAYYFKRTGEENSMIARFLRDLLSSMYGYTGDSVEKITTSIIGKLP